MQIHRLMQMVFVSASVCTALPAFAGSVLPAHDPAPLCGGDSDDDGDDEDDDDKDDKDGETRLCGGDSDDGDGDDGDDSSDDDGTETLRL